VIKGDGIVFHPETMTTLYNFPAATSFMYYADRP